MKSERNKSYFDYYYKKEIQPFTIPVLTKEIVGRKDISKLRQHIFKFYIEDDSIIDSAIIKNAFTYGLKTKNVHMLKIYKENKQIIKKCFNCSNFLNSQILINCPALQYQNFILFFSPEDNSRYTEHSLDKLKDVQHPVCQ